MGTGTAQVNSLYRWSQSFIAGMTGTLDQIDVKVTYNAGEGFTLPNADLQVCLWTASGTAPVSELGCGTITVATITATGGNMTWESVTFAPGFAVTAGTSYAIVLKSSATAGTPSHPSGYLWQMAEQGTNPYANGDSRLSTSNSPFNTEGAFDDANFKTYVASPSAAMFRSGSAVRTDHGVVVRWRMATEINTLGFNVYRVVNGKSVRVNGRLIRVRGTTYTVVDRKATRSRNLRYRIEAVQTDGSRNWLGPLAVKRQT